MRAHAIALALLLALFVCVSSEPASAATGRGVVVGGVGDVETLSKIAGKTLPKHNYGRLDQTKVPDGDFVNMRSTVRWAQVANATPNSPVYAQIVRWADQLKTRKATHTGRVMLAFHHEPENSTNVKMGTPEDYKRAYRKVAQVFEQRGASNVDMVLQMTAWSYGAPAHDKRSIARWYPGDDVVDIIGADPYNWFTCNSSGQPWRPLESVAGKSLAFAKAHGKQLTLAEFGSQAGPKRGQWLADADRWITANSASIHSAWYFQNQDPKHMDCRWPIKPASAAGSGPSEASAWRALAAQ
jgi:hypothetical protein